MTATTPELNNIFNASSLSIQVRPEARAQFEQMVQVKAIDGPALEEVMTQDIGATLMFLRAYLGPGTHRAPAQHVVQSLRALGAAPDYSVGSRLVTSKKHGAEMMALIGQMSRFPALQAAAITSASLAGMLIYNGQREETMTLLEKIPPIHLKGFTPTFWDQVPHKRIDALISRIEAAGRQNNDRALKAEQ